MTVRIKATKDLKRLTEERNAAMQVRLYIHTYINEENIHTTSINHKVAIKTHPALGNIMTQECIHKLANKKMTIHSYPETME